MIGLANVDNTSDVSKPVSTLQQTALYLKANADMMWCLVTSKAKLANPTFTGTLTLTGAANITSNLYTDGYVVIGNVACNSTLVTESALQVCSYRQDIPTQFGVHIGTDYGTWDCGMNICSGYDSNKAHIDFSYVGNTATFFLTDRLTMTTQRTT